MLASQSNNLSRKNLEWVILIFKQFSTRHLGS